MAFDALHQPVTLRYRTVTGKSDELSETIKAWSPILVAAYTETELQFAKQVPEALAGDFMLNSIAPLVNSCPDWDSIKSKISGILHEFITTTDWATHADVDGIYYLVTATDQTTGHVLGVMQFIISPKFAAGHVKSGLSGIALNAHKRGIDKLLMSLMFKIKPDTERLFLHTRSTNAATIAAYTAWGFKPFAGPLAYWTDLEYVAKNATTLQKRAEGLVKQQ